MNAAIGHIRLMLVAPESETIQGLARDLFLLDEHIETTIRHQASAALELLSVQNFDAVAVDLYLPGDGATTLLSGLQSRFPRIIRLVLAEAPDDAIFAQAAHYAHCLLPRPCDSGTLYEALVDTTATTLRMRDPALSAAVAGVLALPESPAMRRELLSLLADDEIELNQLEEAVERNPAIVAKLLQIGNSAYYGSRGSVTSVGEAISMLGFDTVRGIVTSAHLFNALPCHPQQEFPMHELWNHCVSTAVMVRRIAWHVRASASINRAAFTAALLHDVGKVVMALAHGEAYAALRRHPESAARPLWQEEQRLFGHHHGNAGALLLELWGLPSSVIEAVALHHTPHRTREGMTTPLTLVHIANALVHKDNPGGVAESHLDFNYLQRLLLPGKLDLWQAALTTED